MSVSDRWSHLVSMAITGLICSPWLWEITGLICSPFLLFCLSAVQVDVFTVVYQRLDSLVSSLVLNPDWSSCHMNQIKALNWLIFMAYEPGKRGIDVCETFHFMCPLPWCGGRECVSPCCLGPDPNFQKCLTSQTLWHHCASVGEVLELPVELNTRSEIKQHIPCQQPAPSSFSSKQKDPQKSVIWLAEAVLVCIHSVVCYLDLLNSWNYSQASYEAQDRVASTSHWLKHDTLQFWYSIILIHYNSDTL